MSPRTPALSVRQLRRKSGVRSGDWGVALPSWQLGRSSVRRQVGIAELRDAKVAAANARGLLSSNDLVPPTNMGGVPELWWYNGNCSPGTLTQPAALPVLCVADSATISGDAPRRCPSTGDPRSVSATRWRGRTSEKWIDSAGFRADPVQSIGPSALFRACISPISVYDTIAYTRYAGQRGDDYTVEVGSGDDRLPKPQPAGPMSAATSSIISMMCSPG